MESPRPLYKEETNEIDHKLRHDMLIVDLYCSCEIHLYLLTAVKLEYLRGRYTLPRGFSVLRSCLAFLFDEKLQIA